MIFARTLKAAAAAAIVACSAGVAVVASAFALYALLRLALNPAASAAIVATLFALIGVTAALLTARTLETDTPSDAASALGFDPALIGKITELAGDHPLLTAGATLAAGALALKNPDFVAGLIKAIVDGQLGSDPGKKPGG